jgi:hypothetical protein
MKTFKERIKYYIIGLGMGVIAVAFLFGERSCAWLPGNQVKNTIAVNEIIYGDSIKELMTCSFISNDQIYGLLNNDGSVDFSESKTQDSPKIYVFDGLKDLKVSFALYENYSEVIDLHTECKSLLSNKNKETLPLPQKIVTSIIENNEFKYYPITECEMISYGLSENDVESFHKTAVINMDKSIVWPKGKGENVENKKYYLDGYINNIAYSIMYEIGENRTRIKHIIGDSPCECE